MATLGTLFAFLAVVATIIYGEIQRRLAQEQLRLTREQAALRPKLVIEGVLLDDLESIPGLLERVREAEEDQRAEAEEERERNRPMSDTDRLAWEIKHRRRGSGEKYRGALPDKVLKVRVRNGGTVTAVSVEATVLLQASYLEPLEYFTGVKVTLSADDENDPYAAYIVDLGGRDLDIAPGPTYRDLLVAVRVLSAGTTRVFSTLATATTSTERSTELEIPVPEDPENGL